MLLHLRIQLDGVKKPPVWRALTVSGELRFDDFHRIIQAAFGWTNSHLYLFSPDGFPSSPWIKIPDPSDEEEDVRVLDAEKTRLKEIFPANQRYTYLYDFGDSWLHRIKLERFSEGSSPKVALTAGKGACPPEDCGGHWGYEDLKEKLADPTHPEYGELRDWLGLEEDEDWDPAKFNLREAQDAVDEALRSH